MEPADLKREFGSHLVFWGGMDTQRFLPNASVGEVRAEAQRLIPGLQETIQQFLGALPRREPEVDKGQP